MVEVRRQHRRVKPCDKPAWRPYTFYEWRFPGHGRFEGEVTAWQEEGERVGYKLRYDDGDEESEIPMVEVLKLLMPESTNKKGKAKKRGRPSVE